MGVQNVGHPTRSSMGAMFDHGAAIAHRLDMIADGADGVIDVREGVRTRDRLRGR